MYFIKFPHERKFYFIGERAIMRLFRSESNQKGLKLAEFGGLMLISWQILANFASLSLLVLLQNFNLKPSDSASLNPL
jgi:hypothetical protein